MGFTTRIRRWILPASGAVFAVFVGLILSQTPLGDPWTDASYDYLFRFGSRGVTNPVTLVLMDNAALDHYGQTRGQPWSRALHTTLLNRLADDDCQLIVFDSFFRELRNSNEDAALAQALRRPRRVALMAGQAQVAHPLLDGAQPLKPADPFLEATGTNWGVAWLNPDLDGTVRRQWPFPSPGPYPSLPWTAAELTGKSLPSVPTERWLRYYGPQGHWERMSYQYALNQPAGHFRNRIVFIGNWPATSLRDDEQDKFSTPYTRWNGETCGGIEILATAFLNLSHDESLLRPSAWAEALVFTIAGISLGAGLCRLRIRWAVAAGCAAALGASAAAIWLSYQTNYWFPWLIIAGAQVPSALGVNLAGRLLRRRAAAPVTEEPATPGYALSYPPIGEGAYGKVWLARTKSGQWRALKIVYLANFPDNPAPFDREFDGIRKYQSVSGLHPGLLRLDFLSPKQADHFYYVMELADSLAAGWESDPASYKPRDLLNERAQFPKRRVPVRRCIEIGISLCEALDFLHQRGVTHRDIKPQNIIFVGGQPKLADLGLITDLRPDDRERTNVGTPGYMPPAPERPGTVAADIYALGMVLYVVATGRPAAVFPELATTLIDPEQPSDFLLLNDIVLKACQPLPTDRYASALEMRDALRHALVNAP